MIGFIGCIGRQQTPFALRRPGVGCGVGIGYGFGVGMMLKPSAAQNLATSAQHAARWGTQAVQSKLKQAGIQIPEGLAIAAGNTEQRSASNVPSWQSQQSVGYTQEQSHSTQAHSSAMPMLGPYASNMQGQADAHKPSSIPESYNEQIFGGDRRSSTPQPGQPVPNEVLMMLIRQQQEVENLKLQNQEIKFHLCRLDSSAPFCRKDGS